MRSNFNMRSFKALSVAFLVVIANTVVVAQSETKNAPPMPSPTTPVDCESLSAYVETAAVMAHEHGEDSYLIAIARLGDGERSRALNLSRISAMRAFLGRGRLKSVVAEGERVRGYGRVELYVGGKLLFVLPIGRDKQLDFLSCKYA